MNSMKYNAAYLESIEGGIIGDIGELFQSVKVPCVCLARRKHHHPAQLVSHPLLHVWNHTCTYRAGETLFNSHVFSLRMLPQQWVSFVLIQQSSSCFLAFICNNMNAWRSPQ